ncbi:Oocyte zinc finger protein XlCOF22 [Frankliniella fusca]|uniref:Oocyte zinc finger protein XlCOF22 n=1 Tax=Frankliniella fusca TaxID=407009 RepID=A0AAE1LGQ9_9NEOP|nr:Oocyte zinc finger protein XlCOF22 [Frankliniella fusca]
MSGESCVFCKSQFKLRKELLDHFRQHANQEIDIKGRPVLNCNFMKSNSDQCLNVEKNEVSELGKCSNLGNKFSEDAVKEKPSQQPQYKKSTCDICKIYFKSAASAITHRWREHPFLPSKFCCSFCGKQFPLETLLDDHLFEDHKNSKPQQILSCVFCQGEFYNDFALDFHIREAHKGF